MNSRVADCPLMKISLPILSVKSPGWYVPKREPRRAWQGSWDVWVSRDNMFLPRRSTLAGGLAPAHRTACSPASVPPGARRAEIYLHSGTHCHSPSQPCTWSALVGNPTWFHFQFWKSCCGLKTSLMMRKSQSEQLLCPHHPAKA
jgi:hypothetical protein